jgi:hypothetical protein
MPAMTCTATSSAREAGLTTVMVDSDLRTGLHDDGSLRGADDPFVTKPNPSSPQEPLHGPSRLLKMI